jgi:hypothetical protein
MKHDCNSDSNGGMAALGRLLEEHRPKLPLHLLVAVAICRKSVCVALLSDSHKNQYSSTSPCAMDKRLTDIR